MVSPVRFDTTNSTKTRRQTLYNAVSHHSHDQNKPARSRRMRQPFQGGGGGRGALRGRTRDTYSGTASPWASASSGADSGCSQAAGTSVIAWPTPQGRPPHTPYCTTTAAAAPAAASCGQKVAK